MFKDMHKDWIPYKEREEKALELFKEGLALLEENKKNYFGIASGDIQYAIMCHTLDGNVEFGNIHVEDKETGEIIIDLERLLTQLYERWGLSLVTFKSSEWLSHTLQGKVNE